MARNFLVTGPHLTMLPPLLQLLLQVVALNSLNLALNTDLVLRHFRLIILLVLRR